MKDTMKVFNEVRILWNEANALKMKRHEPVRKKGNMKWAQALRYAKQHDKELVWARFYGRFKDTVS